MANYKIVNKLSDKCLNIYGDNVTVLANNQNVTIWEDSGTNEQKWSISSPFTNTNVKSVIGEGFGLNVYRGSSLWNCDVYPISGNETDSAINLVASGSYYKFQLTNYPSYYLTAAGKENGANVYWAKDTNGDDQLWSIKVAEDTTPTQPIATKTLLEK